MVKHNNIVPNVHFHKWWQRYVKTWFNQPGRKASRRFSRYQKAQKISPRPLQLLRPVVRPPTQRYNIKTRLGRGFSLDELRAQGLTKKTARTIGIAVDHRRRNRSAESLRTNSLRLNTFQRKCIRFPKGSKAKKGFGGVLDDSSREELANATQIALSSVLPLPRPSKKLEARPITEADKKFEAYATLRKAIAEAKNVCLERINS
ncbi:ribosomal protein RPL13 [Cardiosporidium cionae]|uniref:60S ribosomal protein L13 n=1 Tax=Cardiosporidium cionae TaxID=476202 RepID=A0ABQ7J5N5_9APIC|nr:ribosomal protein RPL13 [Cardiosporidium cionae]|eukprot:KAF8819279.1 ribosomal protein RPL13 [Cardiosporidium cionae]